MALPRVEADLSPLRPAARLRVTPDGVDLDLRACTAALPASERRRVQAGIEPFGRDASLVESRGLVRLYDGRLRNDDERRLAREVLFARWAMARRALVRVDDTGVDSQLWSTIVLFVDARVPMATMRELWLGLSSPSALALRGPHGVTLLPIESHACGPVPSVELDVSAGRFVLRSTSERGGCTSTMASPRWCETVIARDGADGGARRLREALAAAPWALDAERAHERCDPVGLMLSAEPWGEISIRVDEEVPLADFVAAVMTARARSPGSCHENVRPAGCLFPHFTISVVRSAGARTVVAGGLAPRRTASVEERFVHAPAGGFDAASLQRSQLREVERLRGLARR